MNSSPVASPAGELLRERDRVVSRLAAMPLAAIPQERVLAAVQQLADLAAATRGDITREVPRLAPYAAADQVSVLVGEVHDTAAVGAGSPDRLLSQATRILGDLRRSLA